MIGRGSNRNRPEPVDEEPKGFDSFDLSLGDVMRGERATLGKSLLDVQRELKIKAAYVAAIENADPTAFDTPGFIAGYVRSYARYLGMDSEWAFQTFCRESGFATAHGMSAEASGVRPGRAERNAIRQAENDIFAAPVTPYVPAGEAMFSRVEPAAIGSVLVLLALLGGLGYGGWAVLQEVQRVQLAPVEQPPTVIADVDPLAGNSTEVPGSAGPEMVAFAQPSAEALDRLYRPQALEVPVLTPRDGPIATLDPRNVGSLANDPQVARAAPAPMGIGLDPGLDVALEQVAAQVSEAAPSGVGVQVTETAPPGVTLVAVRDAWVRVRSPEGTVLYETIMTAGDTYEVPQTEVPATLRIGESGAVYFAVGDRHYGPVGPRGSVTSNLALSVDNITETYTVADLDADPALAEIVRVAEVATPALEVPASE